MAKIVKIDDKTILPIIHGGSILGEISKPYSKKIFLVDVHIAGTNYVENIKDLEPGLKDGTKVHFFREQENEHDPLAIVIKDDQGNKLGYIPRRKNEILARLMDAGKLIYGTVFKKQQTGNWIKIELQVYLDD